MMHVPISAEFLDEYVVDTLILDLNIIRQSVIILEAKSELQPWQEQDLDYDKFLIESLQNILTYYIPYDDYETKVGIPHPRPID